LVWRCLNLSVLKNKNRNPIAWRVVCAAFLTFAEPVWFKVESEQGIAAVEYGLLAALIAVVIVTAVTLVGTRLSTVFTSVANSI